jgi:DtxR family transcriptional regulator, manganese transport regulator
LFVISDQISCNVSPLGTSSNGIGPMLAIRGKSAMSWRPREERAETPLRLPDERIQARRFGKTRSAQSSALLEDYVELIADLLATTGEARATDIARRLGVSHVTTIKAISRLKRVGVATGRPYRGVFLTKTGQALAERVRARHRMVVNVLLALGVPTEAAEADAEGMEHYVSDSTLKAFARFLHPQAYAGRAPATRLRSDPEIAASSK